ncbi:MAG: PAS domain S-box protein, partial [Prolixibacteraceae bacterium]|nr:PAS domain S-box protein [Prolixibacteraceae bacterium]
IPDRDIFIDSSMQFTLINPAYMTRQVYELEKNITEVRGHITSLNPVRPENAPDNWELIALKAFENGATEFSEVDTLNGKQYFRFMRPFITEESCLKCHAHQGYKVNDIRGGVSVSYPMDQIYLFTNRDVYYHYSAFVIIWILGLVIIIFSTRRVFNSAKKQLAAEGALRLLNINLEETVETRSKELQKSRRDWENIFNTLGAPAQLINSEHDIIFVNEATLNVFNLQREEIIGKKCYSVLHLSDRPPFNCPLKKSLLDNNASKEEIFVKVQNETYLVNCSPIFDENGKTESFMHIMTDITERKNAELQLKENEKKLDLIFETIPIAVNLIDKEGIILDCNSSLVQLHAYENKEELIGQHNSVLFPESEIERTKKDIAIVESMGNTNGLLYTLKRKDGTTFPAEISSSLFFDEVKNEMCLVSTAINIKNRLEAELQNKSIIEQASDAFYLSDFDGNLIEVNRQATKEMGYSIQEFSQMKVWDLDKDYPDLNAVRNFWNSMKLNEPVTFETKHKRKDGSIFDVELRSTIIEINGEKVIMGFARNISERKKTQEELAKYRMDLEKLVKERTEELETKNSKLEQMNKAFVGRELRMIELKKEIEKLKNG